MKVSEIQPNLLSILTPLAVWGAQAAQVLFVDNGLQVTPMEEALKDIGAAVLIMKPEGLKLLDSARGAAKIGYTSSIWVRTNPKVQATGVPVWDPLLCEDAILTAVMEWSRPRSDFGFAVNQDALPETDWTDVGNETRLIRFITGVHYN